MSYYIFSEEWGKAVSILVFGIALRLILALFAAYGGDFTLLVSLAFCDLSPSF